MAKIPFNDVTPPNRRSIRDIPIPNSGRRKNMTEKNSDSGDFDTSNLTDKKVQSSGINIIRKNSDTDTYEKKQTDSLNESPIQKSNAYEYYYPKRNSEEYKNSFNGGVVKSKKKYLYSGFAVFAILIFVVSMMTVFSSATVTINPKNTKLTVSLESKASINPSSDEIKSEIIKISKSKTVEVQAKGEEEVELKSSGRIVIYNNHSTEPQRLIIRTRFESPDGLIYRIPESVVVPGKKTENGVSVPGSIEVVVFADESGEKYNLGKTDFTIPGFKNDNEMYKNFYAKSVTEMTGGFVGKRKTVSESEKQEALLRAEEEAKNELLKYLKTRIPDDFVYLEKGVYFESSVLPDQDSGANVVVGKEVLGHFMVLNKKDLTREIFKQEIEQNEEWLNIEPYIDDFSGLSLLNGLEKEKLEESDLNIEGEVSIFANIDRQSIKDRLLGLKRKEAEFLMDEFNGVSSIKAVIRPSWKASFPDNPDKININIAY